MLHTPRQAKLFFSPQELALVGITMIWGGTFLVVHLAVQTTGPMFFVALRFVAAGLVSALVFQRHLRGMTRVDLIAGSAIGITIFFGYGLQTYGLQTISSSTSAFITALYVPMVPLLQWLVFRKAPRLMTLVGVVLAFIGLILLANPFQNGLAFGVGETATLVSTVAIAGEIILIGWFAGKVHVGRVTTVQLLVGGGLAFVAMPMTGESLPAFSWVWLAAAVALGVASCLIQLTMNWAQRTVDPTRATVIYASEPVWAGVVGRIAGDRLPGIAIFGAVLIVIGVLLSELKPRSRRSVRGRHSGARAEGAPTT